MATNSPPNTVSLMSQEQAMLWTPF